MNYLCTVKASKRGDGLDSSPATPKTIRPALVEHLGQLPRVFHARGVLPREVEELLLRLGHESRLPPPVALQVWVILGQDESRLLWGFGLWRLWDEACQFRVANQISCIY